MATDAARAKIHRSPLLPKCMDPPCVARENGEAGVRSCTNVSGLVLELLLRAIMEIRAHPISLATMPLRAISGLQNGAFWLRKQCKLDASQLRPRLNRISSVCAARYGACRRRGSGTDVGSLIGDLSFPYLTL